MKVPPNVYRATVIIAFVTIAELLHPSSSKAASDTYDGPPTPCDKELSVADVSGLLVGTARVQHYSELASSAGEGCIMGVGGGSSFAMVDVAAKPGDAAMLKRLGGHGANAKPVPDIGDEAWTDGEVESNIPHATELMVYARKGDVLCMTSLDRSTGPEGSKLLIPKTPDALAAKLGELCTKIFAARAK